MNVNLKVRFVGNKAGKVYSFEYIQFVYSFLMTKSEAPYESIVIDGAYQTHRQGCVNM